MSSSPTPAQLGFRMPAEWETHAGTWLTWPRPDGVSFPDRYFAVPPVYAKFIQPLFQVEQVNINVWDADMENWVGELLKENNVPCGLIVNEKGGHGKWKDMDKSFASIADWFD